MAPLVDFGIILFSLVLVFQLVTLPVEFNASRRAISVLDQIGILDGEELTGAKNVLRAAAMTYVAAVLTSLAQLLRLILLSRRSDD
jgi:Zn-dependent membrane protease YugP